MDLLNIATNALTSSTADSAWVAEHQKHHLYQNVAITALALLTAWQYKKSILTLSLVGVGSYLYFRLKK